MNFIDVTAERSDGRVTLTHPDFSYPMSDQFDGEIPGSDGDLVLGVRPEDIEVTEDASEAVVEVTVGVIEPLGKEQLIHFDLGGETYTASVSGQRRIRRNERVALRFPEPLVYVFDRDTGDTIKHQEWDEVERQPEGLSPDAE